MQRTMATTPAPRGLARRPAFTIGSAAVSAQPEPQTASYEALPTSVAVEVPLAEWVPSADRQDLCRQMNDKAS
jgi:hypothetical protein